MSGQQHRRTMPNDRNPGRENNNNSNCCYCHPSPSKSPHRSSYRTYAVRSRLVHDQKYWQFCGWMFVDYMCLTSNVKQTYKGNEENVHSGRVVLAKVWSHPSRPVLWTKSRVSSSNFLFTSKESSLLPYNKYCTRTLFGRALIWTNGRSNSEL